MAQKSKCTNALFTIVSKMEAKSVPYPYVYVNDDGSVRELHQSECTYLETPFSPFDGARPYIKNSYTSKNGWGDIGGFCLRIGIPSNITILESPLEDPSEFLRKIFKEKETKLAKERGFEIIEIKDSTVSLRRRKT
jgi:hypothetical protein